MTPIWDAESVLAASNEWAWVPDYASSVRTEEYLVVAYPESYLTPTGARLLGSDRDPADVVDEVHGVTRDLGRERLWWTLSDTSRPPSLEAELVRRGAQVTERMDVLALDVAVRAGATLALTHGRVDTSSPILRRLGFRRYGEQRQLVIDL